MNKFNFIISAFLSSVLFLSGCGSGCNSGDGKKIGRVVRLGSHGMMCSTYEGELVRGGFSDGSGANGNSMRFTVKNTKIYHGLMKAMENQQEVEISYQLHGFYGPCYAETGVIATGFKILKKNNDELKKTEEEKPVQVIQFDDDTL